MPFDFNDFLTLAEALGASNDPSSQRTAISRAYYSVYHLAFNRAEQKVGRYSRNTGKSYHEWCWSQYSATPDQNCQQLGTDGDRLRRLRVKADYKAFDIPRLQEEVARVLQDARAFQAAIAALDQRYPRP